MKEKQEIKKVENKEIIDILRQQIETAEHNVIEIDVADVCRLLKCKNYKIYYRPCLLNKHIDVEKDRICLLENELYINNDTYLDITDFVKFKGSIIKIDGSFLISVESFENETVGLFYFEFKPTLGYVKSIYKVLKKRLISGKEVIYDNHFYVLRSTGDKKKLIVDYKYNYMVE